MVLWQGVSHNCAKGNLSMNDFYLPRFDAFRNKIS